MRNCKLLAIGALLEAPIEVLDLRGATIHDREIRKLLQMPQLTMIYLDIEQFPDDLIEAMINRTNEVKQLTPSDD
jgi:hypothetical protein